MRGRHADLRQQWAINKSQDQAPVDICIGQCINAHTRVRTHIHTHTGTLMRTDNRQSVGWLLTSMQFSISNWLLPWQHGESPTGPCSAQPSSSFSSLCCCCCVLPTAAANAKVQLAPKAAGAAGFTCIMHWPPKENSNAMRGEAQRESTLLSLLTNKEIFYLICCQSISYLNSTKFSIIFLSFVPEIGRKLSKENPTRFTNRKFCWVCLCVLPFTNPKFLKQRHILTAMAK